MSEKSRSRQIVEWSRASDSNWIPVGRKHGKTEADKILISFGDAMFVYTFNPYRWKDHRDEVH